LRLSLLDESFHPFFSVFGGEDQIEGLPLEFQGFVERRLESVVNRFLGGLDGERRLGGDFLGEVFGLFLQ
jgi:hypothetical protein